MGKKLNTGLAHGATASSQLSIENNEYDDKVRKLAEDIELEEGIRELERAHVKFTRDAVRFVTIDRTGQLVWLEDGNESVGLKHILYGSKERRGHEDDFIKSHSVEKDNVVQYLKDVITYGDVEYCVIKVKNGREGFEKLYKYMDKYYMICAIGMNGFLVSAYPVNRKTAKANIRRYKK